MANWMTQAVALVFIALGVLFLVANLLPGWAGAGVWWPLLVVIPGLIVLLPVALAKDPVDRASLAWLVIPGLTLTVLGLILLITTFTERSSLAPTRAI